MQRLTASSPEDVVVIVGKPPEAVMDTALTSSPDMTISYPLHGNLPTAINMLCHSTLLNWIQQQMLLHGNFTSSCLVMQISISWIHSQCSRVIIRSLCTIHSPLDQVFICMKIKTVQVLWVHWQMPWSFLKLAPTTWPDWQTIRMVSCSSHWKFLLSCCF